MSLVSAATLREYLPEIQGVSVDTDLNSLLSRTEEMIAKWLGLPGVSPGLAEATLTLYVDGPTSTNSSVLQLPIRPLVSVSTVHSDPNLEYGSSTEITVSDLILNLEWSRLILKPTVSTRGFVHSYRGNKVVGIFGFSASSPPSDLVHAICVWASQLQRQKQTLGKLSIGQRGNSITPAIPKMPEEVKEILRPFRSPSVLM
jgi:hypothetical protein